MSDVDPIPIKAWNIFLSYLQNIDCYINYKYEIVYKLHSHLGTKNKAILKVNNSSNCFVLEVNIPCSIEGNNVYNYILDKYIAKIAFGICMGKMKNSLTS